MKLASEDRTAGRRVLTVHLYTFADTTATPPLSGNSKSLLHYTFFS